MVWYTVKLDGKLYKFLSKQKLEKFIEDNKGKNFTVIERRSNGDTKKPETYT